MEKIYEEVTVKKLVRLTSADGEYTRYVKDADEEELSKAEHDVKGYEESALGAMGAIINDIPHAKVCADSYESALFCPNSFCSGDDRFYIFKTRTEEDVSNIWKWMHLNYTGQEPAIFGKMRIETDGNGVQYLSAYIHKGNPNYKLNPADYAGKTIVVHEVADYRMNWLGSLEEIEERRKFTSEYLFANHPEIK